MITIDNYKTITLEGVGAVRTLMNTGTGIMFSLTNGQLTLDGNVTLDGANVNRNYLSTMVSINSGSTFTMKNGTKIANSLKTIGTTWTRGAGVMVNHSTASFIMEGGEITNCSALIGGGVTVTAGTFAMSGGSITGNTATHYGNDVEIATGSIIKLSGNAKIGDLLLAPSTTVTLSSNFTGSVTGLYLGGLAYRATTPPTIWVNGDVRVITPASGAILTKELLDKFPLRYFCGNSGYLGEYTLLPITGFHLYGTNDGETDAAKMGTLVAD